MELCVATKYCIAHYLLNEARVLKKFGQWLFHAKNINSLGVKPRVPVPHWAPEPIGCSPLPSSIFLLPPWAMNLCYVAGVGTLPCMGKVHPLCCRERGNPARCPRSWPGSVVANGGCRLRLEVALQLSPLPWAVLSLLLVPPGKKGKRSAAVGAVSRTCSLGMSDIPSSSHFPC